MSKTCAKRRQAKSPAKPVSISIPGHFEKQRLPRMRRSHTDVETFAKSVF
jgi:hypothetical protein